LPVTAFIRTSVLSGVNLTLMDGGLGFGLGTDPPPTPQRHGQYHITNDVSLFN